MGDGSKVTAPVKLVWVGVRYRGSIALAVQFLLLALLFWKTDILSFQTSFQFNSGNNEIREEWRWSKVRIPSLQPHSWAIYILNLTRNIDCADKRSHLASLL